MRHRTAPDTENITREEIEAGFTAPNGTKVARDVFTARFKPEVPESRIREIVAAHGGIIIGANPEDKRIQVRLVPAPASLKALFTTMHQMLQRPEVVWMHPTYLIDSGITFDTNNFKFAGLILIISLIAAFYILMRMIPKGISKRISSKSGWIRHEAARLFRAHNLK